MRAVFLLALMLAPVISAQEATAIYKERCASCHDMPVGRVPALASMREMSAQALYASLTNGSMKSQAEGLSKAQLIALIIFIAPTGGKKVAAPLFPATCNGPSLQFNPKAPQWDGWSPDIKNSRFQDARPAGIEASLVPLLKLKWAFNLGKVSVARSQPTIVGGRVFLSTQTGAVYALDADTGCTRWGFQADAEIRSGGAFGDSNGVPAIFFTDARATVYALDAKAGKLIWKARPVEQSTALATATPRFYKGVLYQPIASFEEALGANPKYSCCTFRGSVVALDTNNGQKIWQSFTVPEAAKPTGQSPAGIQEYGPSGASVWSSPTVDQQTGALYLATGNNYSDPPTATSDAILAIELTTGKLLWSTQLTGDDVFNDGCSSPRRTNCQHPVGPDYDFGQSPILVSLGGAKRALVIAQKSGMVYAVDPDQKGKLLWKARAGEGGTFGGSQWGSASDGHNVYVAISGLAVKPVADTKSPQGYHFTLDPQKGGGLVALDLKSGKIVWSAKPATCPASRSDCSPAQSAAVTAIPGVIFSGSVDGHLRAYSATTGDVLWDTDTAHPFETVNGEMAQGGSIDVAGPAVASGMVFVNSGYGQWGGMPGNVLLAFSVNGK